MKHLAIAALVLIAVSFAFDANARERVRRRFDPDDLELDEVGVVHADLAFGGVRGETAGRWLAPDFDIDLALADNVELGLDGAWAIEGTPNALFKLDHRAPDNLWINTKIMLYDAKNKEEETAWACGVQFGPRAAVQPDAHGTGFQGLALLGGRYHRAHGVLNAGYLVDSGDGVLTDRPTAILAGIDFVWDLTKDGKWSIDSDLGGVFFVTEEKNQLVSTFGPVLQVTDWLEISVNGLVGFLSGGDHYGAYLQISPKIPLW